MCGVLLLSGKNAEKRIQECINRLHHRGPDGSSILGVDDFFLGFTRLIIVGNKKNGKQPFKGKKIISAFNGEIYNYKELIEKHNLRSNIASDCEVIAELFVKYSVNSINKLDGFYSGILYNQVTKELFCLRDYMGKKPLFIGHSGSEVFITSELQAIENISDFEIIPKGLSKVNLKKGFVEPITTSFHDLKDKQSLFSKEPNTLKEIIENAVIKRLPLKDNQIGVFLSGGLDSSIIALIVNKHRPDTTFYCLCNNESKDKKYVERIQSFLKIKNLIYVDIPTDKEFPSLVKKVIEATCSYNPSIISNGIATYLLAQKASEDGLKIILSGEGADELFYGYFKTNKDGLKQKKETLIKDMEFTELRRLDLSCMSHSIESRCPYLDKSVYLFTESLKQYDFYNNDGLNKYPLRMAFKNEIPVEITHREKVSFDVGSGVRRLLREYLLRLGESEKEVLFSLWAKQYGNLLTTHDQSKNPYFHSYPVFDEVINRRGIGHKE